MASALKQSKLKPVPRGQQPASHRRTHLQSVSQLPLQKGSRSQKSPLRVVHPNPARSSVRQLPKSPALPPWLRMLIFLQRGSVVVTTVLIVAALVVYGSTIYMQQSWSKNYRKLKTMQRSERQMVATSEALKNQITQQADQPGSGLVPRTSEHTIFLQPAPDLPAPEVSALYSGAMPVSPIKAVERPRSNDEPLGY